MESLGSNVQLGELKVMQVWLNHSLCKFNSKAYYIMEPFHHAREQRRNKLDCSMAFSEELIALALHHKQDSSLAVRLTKLLPSQLVTFWILTLWTGTWAGFFPTLSIFSVAYMCVCVSACCSERFFFHSHFSSNKVTFKQSHFCSPSPPIDTHTRKTAVNYY